MLLLFTSIVMGFCACSDDDEEITIKAELKANPTSLEFTALGGENEVTVSTKLNTWNVTADASANWCTVTKGESKFTVKVEEFTKRQDRKATLKITSGDESINFIVTQKAVSAELAPEKTEVSINGFGTAVKVKMAASSNEWTATSEDSWIRTEKDGEYLIIRATLSSSDRTGKINLSLNDAKSEITVKQSGAETEIGSLVLAGENGDTPIGVIINNVDNKIYVISMEEKLTCFTNDDYYKMTDIRTDTVKTDGKKALNLIKAVEGYESKYLIAAYCDELEEKTHVKGWYIPAEKENSVWEGLTENKNNINTILKSAGGSELYSKSQNYWTSTIHYSKEDGYASSVIVKNKEQKNQYITPWYKYSARCVLRIEYLSE